MSGSVSHSFNIETEVTPAYYEDLLNYTYRNYLQSAWHRFSNVTRTIVDGNYTLGFTVLAEDKWKIDVSIKTGHPIKVTLTPSSLDVPESALDRLKDDLIIVVQYFEESVRRSTLYFAWVQGRDVVPEKSPFRRGRIVERVLFGNILFLLVLLYAVSIILFFIIGLWAAIVIVVGQFLTVVFGDRLIGTMSDWPVTAETPTVHILQYHLPAKQRESFTKKYTKESLMQMKKEIYDKTIGLGKPVECETARDVMSKYGLECSPENMSTKAINVYEMVKKAAEQYGLSVPKIALSNTMIPNAAASGPSPKRGIVLVTTGLLVQLNPEEIQAVIGHEISHLNSRDPFVLFSIVSGEYLLRIFVLWNYFLPFPLFGLLYIVLVLGGIYFVAKFFEARADLESAIKTGAPKVLAGALRKIGFRRLQFERSPSTKIQDWITWNPHPPIYFRVERLEKLDPSKKVEHTLIQSAKDCVRGFFAAF